MAQLEHPAPPGMHGLLTLRRASHAFSKRVRRLAHLENGVLTLRASADAAPDVEVNVLGAALTVDSSSHTVVLDGVTGGGAGGSTGSWLRLSAHSALKFSLWVRALTASTRWVCTHYYRIVTTAASAPYPDPDTVLSPPPSFHSNPDGVHITVHFAVDRSTSNSSASPTPNVTVHSVHSRSRRVLATIARVARLSRPPDSAPIRDVFEGPRRVDVVYGTALAHSLQCALNRRGGEPVPERAAARIAASLLVQLAHLHARSVVHREVTPRAVALKFGSDHTNRPDAIFDCDTEDFDVVLVHYGAATLTSKRPEVDRLAHINNICRNRHQNMHSNSPDSLNDTQQRRRTPKCNRKATSNSQPHATKKNVDHRRQQALGEKDPAYQRHQPIVNYADAAPFPTAPSSKSGRTGRGGDLVACIGDRHSHCAECGNTHGLCTAIHMGRAVTQVAAMGSRSSSTSTPSPVRRNPTAGNTNTNKSTNNENSDMHNLGEGVDVDDLGSTTSSCSVASSLGSLPAPAAGRTRMVTHNKFASSSGIDRLTLSDLVAAPAYAAPEILGGERYGAPVDVYAVGMMLVYMLRGTPAPAVVPEDGEMEVDVERLLPKQVSVEGKAVVKGLLQGDQRRRMTAEAALRHAWVVGHAGVRDIE